MNSENEVWLLFDEWIRQNGQPSEAISSGWSRDHEVRICYSRIHDNVLVQHDFKIPMDLLKMFTPDTILVIMNDVLLNRFRSEE